LRTALKNYKPLGEQQMKNGEFRIVRLIPHISLACLLLLDCSLTISASPVEKLKAEDVVSKHLESIGTPEQRAAAANRVILGTVLFSFRAKGTGQTVGNAVLASEGTMSLIGMQFPNLEYPHERLGYDGHAFTTGFIRPGVRTVLGDFMKNRDSVFKEGLIGGTLSTAWPLLDIANRNPKIGYEGTDKINGREVYVLSYSPRKGSDVQIRLFFDAATFQHVRSTYSQVMSAMQGRTDKDSARQSASRYQLVEEFGDYKKEGELTLPHTYKLQLLMDDYRGTVKSEWTVTLSQFELNHRVPADSFNVEAYKAGA
jgi:hypothetical protein